VLLGPGPVQWAKGSKHPSFVGSRASAGGKPVVGSPNIRTAAARRLLYIYPEAGSGAGQRGDLTRRSGHDEENRGAIKEPEQWVTGDEPMTGAQDSYLHTLAREAAEEVPEDLTKAEASEKIEELQEKAGRGTKAAPKRKTARKKG
jgi:hypothetical protein